MVEKIDVGNEEQRKESPTAREVTGSVSEESPSHNLQRFVVQGIYTVYRSESDVYRSLS
jgi:hypothetical protein